ncbi:MAG TPA: VOC family protein [Candidatus Sulfotelmatobacter sp.]|nr:VOC family protein [Candidatus Sulfotelmatobacter sp.]
MAFRGFDHVDLRVPSLAAVESFYAALLPKLGLTRKAYSYVDPRGDWYDADAERYNAVEWYEDATDGRAGAFFGVIEDADMVVPRTRIAFAMPREGLEGWMDELRAIGAREVEFWEHEDRYWAVFFTDPIGTRFELVARIPRKH